MLNREFWTRVLLQGSRNIKTYLLAQLKLQVILFIVMAIGLWLIGIPFAILIALGIAIVDILPVIGSGLVFIPWIIIELILGSNVQALHLAILYIIVFVLEQLLEPYFLGKDLNLPFWVPLLITIVCGLLFNIIGIFVAALVIPFVAAFWNLYRLQKQARENKNKTRTYSPK